jgi:HPt (histidine-containing phosphotransfer) domain-containing protein
MDKNNVVVCDAELDDIIPGYLENKCEECVQLRELAEQGDFVEIRTIAHGMKGSGGCYGFPALSDIGRDMEIAVKAGNLAGVLTQVVVLEAYLGRIEVRYE